jgi:exopolyphosphatase/guanosine-5'-triphosphate,3'-diphosphate pyrophosphatase
MSNDRSGGAGPYPRPVTPITPSSPPPADRRPALVGPSRSGRSLCRARSRHEFLPHADRPAQGQPAPRGRFVFQVGAAGAGAGGVGPARPRVDGAHGGRAQDLPQKLDKHRVERMRLVATEACRRATNAAEFIGLVKRDTGLELEIIQPEEEARLAVVSCAPLVSTRTEQLLVVDIGGGSTELVWIDLSRCRARAAQGDHAAAPGVRSRGHALSPAKVVDWISVPLGVATLRTCSRRGRRWRALRADELVFRGTAGRFLAL